MLYFLGLGDWISSIGSNFMGAMEIGIRTLSFSLSTIIYGLIIKLYDVFEILCNGRLLNNEIMKSLSTRIGLILGLVMFFYIIFAMIKMLLEPDKINDKEIGAGNIIKKVILVIVMLGCSNFAFNALYHVQKVVIESHALSNILLPYKIEQDGLDSFGKVLSNELLLSFYQIEDFNVEQLDSESKSNYEACVNTITSFNNQIINSAKFDLGYNCLNESVKISENTGTGAGVVDRDVFIINYNYLIAPLVGCVAVYMLFMYCFKIGVRMIQLAFLEIISPMAFVSYLAPKKDTMFSKWTKIYVATYIDVFIRIVIINFVIFLLATIFAESTEGGSFIFWDTVGGRSSDSALFIRVIIVLALLTFAKKAPDLIKDLLGSSASKLGFGVAMKDIVGLKNTFGMAAGAAGGAAVGLLAGRPLGAVGGLLKGGFSGIRAKGVSSAFSGAWKSQSKANAEIAKVRANGGNWLGHQVAKTQQAVGARTRADDFDDKKATLEKENAIYKQVTGYFDASKKRAESKILEGKDAQFNSQVGITAGQEARKARDMIEILKEQAGQLKPGSSNYASRLAGIQTDIARYQSEYNNNLLVATQEYLNNAATGNGDPVVEQNIMMANGVLDNNKNLAGFRLLASITNYDTFNKADIASNNSISANTVKLSRNASEGKVPRANAGK